MAGDGGKRLTPEAFGKFLRWLSPSDNLAVQAYQLVRKKLIRFFVHKGSTDPDQLFDQTIDIVVSKIDECVEVSNPLAYCYGVAKNVWRRDSRKHKTVEWNENEPSNLPSKGENLDLELKCLDGCVSRLADNDREIITRYHQGQGSTKISERKALAAELGGANALRVRACRIRKDLRLCVVDCLTRSAN
jgi:hypothetical protein